MFSTITTVPSTTMPKSRAPKESRFAGMAFSFKHVAANKRENGIVRATMRAPRTFPRNKNKTMTTRMMPSVRLCRTVWVVK